jgi:hypothetical protein
MDILQNLGNSNTNESNSLYHSVMSNVITPQEVHSVHTPRTLIKYIKTSLLVIIE